MPEACWAFAKHPRFCSHCIYHTLTYVLYLHVHTHAHVRTHFDMLSFIKACRNFQAEAIFEAVCAVLRLLPQQRSLSSHLMIIILVTVLSMNTSH